MYFGIAKRRSLRLLALIDFEFLIDIKNFLLKNCLHKITIK